MMNEQTRPTDQTAALEPAQALSAAARRFEDMLRSGRATRVESFLASDEIARNARIDRDQLLQQLLSIEIRYRRSQGESLLLEEYLRRLPDSERTVRVVFHQLDQAQIATTDALLGDVATQPDDGGQSHNLTPHTRLGRYVVQQVLGQGAFGTVYLARDEELARLVAIKIPRRDRFTSTETMNAFIAEARTVAQLGHPGIVAIHDIARCEDGTPYVIMEYVEGTNLTDLVRTGNLLPVESARVISQVAQAVGHAHKLGFVHRDLKPANVLLDNQGRPRVTDFGLAVHETIQRQRKGELAGTYPYMSPEQIRGDVHLIDGRSDIWSLGVMLYQLLTGRLPFGGDSIEWLSDEILYRDPRPPRQINEEIPEELERIISKCCAKEAKDRYTTASDLARDLNEVVNQAVAVADRRECENPGARRRELRIGFGFGRFSFTVSLAVLSLVLLAGFLALPQYGRRLASSRGDSEADRSRPAQLADAAPTENAPQDKSTVPPTETLLQFNPLAPGPTPAPSFTAGRPKQPGLASDRVYACAVSDEQTGRPIADVAVSWELQRGGPLEKGQQRTLWKGEFVSDSAGRYTARIPAAVVDEAAKTVWLEVHHPKYLPMKGIGVALHLPDDPEKTPDHRHLKLEPGVEVTGNVVLPDGKPAAHVALMFARNRDGFGDYNSGYAHGYWTSTDDDGRYRFFTRNTWPQRVHWFPDHYEANSTALTRDFGQQKTIRLKPGLGLSGKVVDHGGNPMAGIVVRAQTGTRVPNMYATADAEGVFRFTPLPPGTYTLKPVRHYVDNRTGEALVAELPSPIPAVRYDLKAGSASESPSLVIRAAELIRIAVQVVDGKGTPLSGYRLSIGDLGDYVNAVLAKEVEGSPGLYEFQFPKDQWIRDLRVRHPWSEVAFYQASRDVEPVAARAIVLGKADKDSETIRVVIRKSATLNVHVRTEDGEVPAEEFTVGANYSQETHSRIESAERANREFPANFIAPGLVQTQPADQPWNPSFQQIAPGEPLDLNVRSDFYQADPLTVSLDEGEVRSVDIVVRPRRRQGGDGK